MPNTKDRPPEEILNTPETSKHGMSSYPVHRQMSSQQPTDDQQPVKFGELIVLGYNGHLLQGNRGRRKSKYCLLRRPRANGVKPHRKHIVKNPHSSKAVLDSHQHSVSYTLSRNQAVIVEYKEDADTDMFQIGRSSEDPIDFVVTDTIPGHQRNENDTVAQSTISRFACRILVDRNFPYAARIYAAGFDSGRNIFLGEKAVKWYSGEEIDGLTTNGVFIMQPQGNFNGGAQAGTWREVSVGGTVYALRESRSTPHKSNQIIDETNILQDGTLIDLCGATLLWRSAAGLSASPSEREFENMVDDLNAGRPQCPVGLMTLVLPRKGTLGINDKQPFVYIKCGHVHGQHQWGQANEHDGRTCPLCLTVSPFVKLKMGGELSLYVDNEHPTHCFSPCGHMASEKTVKYWSQVAVPHGCQGFQAICPFCATPLDEDPSIVKLIFQDYTD